MVLAARAALRAGAGLVTALVPECGYTIMQAAVPEAMCVTSGTGELNSISDWKQYQAIGIGPGMGVTDATRKALADFLEDALEPVVLDADALNIIGQQHDLLSRLPRGSVITPHPKEFSRIFGENTNSMIQLDNARIQAMRYGINIVLKGHYTAVIDAEGECWYNITGNPGMATGGSGDVLTGLITGLLAQGYQPHEAAVMGVYLHGLAGDIAAGKHSQEAMIAGDIVENLGAAFASVAG
jgi:NAD(P)H-hydrate epimerase